RRIVEPGLAQQYVGKQTAAHADFAMNAPHRQRNAFLIQRRFPREHMLVHTVDESAVEIEEKGCFVACHDGSRSCGKIRDYATFSGSLRSRCPVSAYTALATAGAIGGVPGSPTPPGCSSLEMMSTSIAGHSSMRSGA